MGRLRKYTGITFLVLIGHCFNQEVKNTPFGTAPLKLMELLSLGKRLTCQLSKSRHTGRFVPPPHWIVTRPPVTSIKLNCGLATGD